MDSETVKWALTFASAACELGGIGLIVAEIASTRRQARQVASTTTVAPASISHDRAIGQPTVHGGREPTARRPNTVERKLPPQEEAVRALGKRLDREGTRLDREISETSTEAKGEAIRRDEALRAFLRDQLEGAIHLRAWGAVLVSLGIVLAIPANLVG